MNALGLALHYATTNQEDALRYHLKALKILEHFQSQDQDVLFDKAVTTSDIGKGIEFMIFLLKLEQLTANDASRKLLCKTQ